MLRITKVEVMARISQFMHESVVFSLDKSRFKFWRGLIMRPTRNNEGDYPSSEKTVSQNFADVKRNIHRGVSMSIWSLRSLTTVIHPVRSSTQFPTVLHFRSCHRNTRPYFHTRHPNTPRAFEINRHTHIFHRFAHKILGFIFFNEKCCVLFHGSLFRGCKWQ